jgi:HEAT repeats/PBS lyase HEAT-like repeat
MVAGRNAARVARGGRAPQAASVRREAKTRSAPRVPLLAVALLVIVPATAQGAPPDARARAKAVREYGKQGGSAIVPKLATYLSDPDLDVRVEAVKAIVDIGTQYSLDPLVLALADIDPEIQIRATDGLVSFYVPGYVKTGGGLTSSLRRAGSAIRSRFTDTNDQIVDAWIQVRPQVTAGLGKVARGGASMDARANAARAIGVLRGRAAVPDLIEALQTKDSRVIYEVLIALQKIRDPSVASSIEFLSHDLDERVQATALETLGLLQDRGALPQMREALDHTRSTKVRRAALEAIAMVPDASVHDLLKTWLTGKDDVLRGSAAEGLGRLKDRSDAPAIEKMFSEETKSGPRLAAAFALAETGNLDMSAFAPLRYLVNDLNLAAWRGVARPYLVELARDPAVRQALYPALGLKDATKDEKTGLAEVFAASGAADSIPSLEALSRDPDPEVAQAGLRALQAVKARTAS